MAAAIALALAENAADVAFTYQSWAERSGTVVKSIEGMGHHAFAINADSADPKSIVRPVRQAVASLGGLDILVNSAAVGLYGTIT